jgi:hypothetical protein
MKSITQQTETAPAATIETKAAKKAAAGARRANVAPVTRALGAAYFATANSYKGDWGWDGVQLRMIKDGER